ncbi:MAG TPA: TonB-dependent receptor [Gemmatimonadales bacterium]|nr:TonB-dependent receptor [Gemmatimonadales bacterium]
MTDHQTDSGVDGAVVLLQGTLLRARTTERGRFRLAAVPRGTYTVVVFALGYSSDSLPGITVADGDARDVSLSLRRAPVGLSDIVVTANRAPERAEESGASVSVLSKSTLVGRNITTLDQALVFAPGVTINAGQLDIRGSTGLARGVGSRVLLMLDGHPILSGDGGEIDFESLPLLDVDRVEVVRGAYSALYGSNALGGVVNVLTTPIDDQSETTLRLHFGAWQQPERFRFTDNQLEEKGFGIQHSQLLGDVGARVFLGREVSDGYRQDDAHDAWLGRVKLASSPESPHPWDAYAVWARENDGEFFIWRSDSQPYEVDPTTRNDHEIDYKLLTGATFTPLVGANALLRVSPYVNYNSVQNYFPSDSNADRHRATRLGGTVDVSLRVGRHALDLGTDVAHTIVASNFLGPHHINDDALFFQDGVRLSGRWTTSLGARLDYHDASGGKPEWSPSPKIGVTFRPGSGLSTRMSVAHGFRSPSAIEQFVNTTQFGIRVVPNPDLKSERVWSTEAGATATPLVGLRFDASLFESQYRDLIAPCAVNFSTYTFCNLNRARVRGLDISFKTGLADDLVALEGSYLLLDSKDLDSGLPLVYRSRHNVTGTLTALRGLVGLDMRFRSRVQEVLQYPLDPRGTITVFDLRLGYRVAGVALQAKVSNLFQTFYVDVMEKNPGAPRNLSLTAYRAF